VQGDIIKIIYPYWRKLEVVSFECLAYIFYVNFAIVLAHN